MLERVNKNAGAYGKVLIGKIRNRTRFSYQSITFGLKPQHLIISKQTNNSKNWSLNCLICDD